MNKNYLTDTHFHLDLSDDIDKILKESKENCVNNFIISGCDLKGIKEGILTNYFYFYHFIFHTYLIMFEKTLYILKYMHLLINLLRKHFLTQ